MAKRNLEKARETNKRWRENNPEKWRESYRKSAEKNREKRRAQQKEYRERTKEARQQVNAIYHRKRRADIRAKIFELLGGARCTQCGYDKDIRALQLDHINGGGHRQRKTTSPSVYYEEILKSGGKGFQVLCANCNQIKRYEKGEVTGKKLFWEEELP